MFDFHKREKWIKAYAEKCVQEFGPSTLGEVAAILAYDYEGVRGDPVEAAEAYAQSTLGNKRYHNKKDWHLQSIAQ
jgi:hypothetical protein